MELNTTLLLSSTNMPLLWSLNTDQNNLCIQMLFNNLELEIFSEFHQSDVSLEEKILDFRKLHRSDMLVVEKSFAF